MKLDPWSGLFALLLIFLGVALIGLGIAIVLN